MPAKAGAQAIARPLAGAPAYARPAMAKDPVLVAYALTVVVNTLNMTVLWTLSGVARGGTKTTLNPEDAQTILRGAAVVEAEPAAVARVLRVHRNTFDNTIPFLLLAFVFATMRPSALEAQILFGTFTAARLAFSVAYLKGLQPWRSLSYVIGMLVTLALVVEVLRLTFS